MATATYTKAIIRTGGKQYIATPGAVLTVETLPEQPGETVSFSDVVLAFTENGEAVTPKEVTVTAEVVSVGRGTKIRVATYQSKKRHRRVIGHRQNFTKVRVSAIA
jgi:large subunit ribosomal protein L21